MVEYLNKNVKESLDRDKVQSSTNFINQEFEEIELNKNVYGIKLAKDSLDRKFVEFLPKSKKINELFDMYNSLFYYIPVRGKQSHVAIIKQSSKYVGYPINSSINELENLMLQIQTLKDDIDSIENEHPFIPNFSVIRNRNDDQLNYYIQSGRKRKINDYKILTILKVQAGLKSDTPDTSFVILLNSQAIGGIISGPPINTSEDLNIDILEINKHGRKAQLLTER